MKKSILALATIISGVTVTYATDLRETQFPSVLPKTVCLAGIDHPSSECLKPWIAADPSEYSGKYESLTITDGRANLSLKLHEAKSSSGETRWHADGSLETAFGVGVNHEVTFKNAEVQEPKQPCFDVLDRLIPALFVVVTDPENTNRKPMHGIVIGDNVFVLGKELKPGS
jgi:hypothetical protein